MYMYMPKEPTTNASPCWDLSFPAVQSLWFSARLSQWLPHLSPSPQREPDSTVPTTGRIGQARRAGNGNTWKWHVNIGLQNWENIRWAREYLYRNNNILQTKIHVIVLLLTSVFLPARQWQDSLWLSLSLSPVLYCELAIGTKEGRNTSIWYHQTLKACFYSFIHRTI